MKSKVLLITIAVICQALIVVGQLLLKKSIGAAQGGHSAADGSAAPVPWRNVVLKFLLAIACLAVWFFLWLGLMSQLDLSKLFPFEGLNPALLAIAAALVLKERMPLAVWIGMALVCVGIAVVAGS